MSHRYPTRRFLVHIFLSNLATSSNTGTLTSLVHLVTEYSNFICSVSQNTTISRTPGITLTLGLISTTPPPATLQPTTPCSRLRRNADFLHQSRTYWSVWLSSVQSHLLILTLRRRGKGQNDRRPPPWYDALQRPSILSINPFPEFLGRNEKSIWDHYNEMAAMEDDIRHVEWGDFADVILVFVCIPTLNDTWLLIWPQDGLFAGVVSAFIIFTIPMVQANSNDIALDVLMHISRQLGNSTVPAYTHIESTFTPNALCINALLSISLVCMVIDAILAMLVKMWLRELDRQLRQHTVADHRAKERERRVQALKRWKLDKVIPFLPLLLLVSLVFFFCGLLVFIFTIWIPGAIVYSIVLGIVTIAYLFTVFVPIFDPYAPFSPIVSSFFTGVWGRARKVWTSSSAATRPNVGDGAGMKEVATQGSQTHVDVLERLIRRTAEGVENIPIFLELLDQPAKYPTLQPNDPEKWKRLLDITLRLLGDPSTYSESVACTIARTMIICHDREAVDQRLYEKLRQRFDNRGSATTGTGLPPNSLFPSYFHIFFNEHGSGVGVCRTIAHLDPSGAVDDELFWMMNTLNRRIEWFQDPPREYGELMRFLAAVLTYISRTEQSKRSNLPLTAAAINAMHTINSAYDAESGLLLPPTPVAASPTPASPTPASPTPASPTPVPPSDPMTFCLVGNTDPLDLWSGECAERISTLLQSHSDQSLEFLHPNMEFRLPLLAALYIDSTKAGGRASGAFADLLRVRNFPDITLDSWGWHDSYDHAKLAMYWYMALFQEPPHDGGSRNDPIDGILHLFGLTMTHSSEFTVSALYLLGVIMKHLRATTTSLDISREDPPSGDNLAISYTLPSGSRSSHIIRASNPWVLLHLDTLFVQSSIFVQEDGADLGYPDTPEKVFIAKARLALYDELEEGGEHEHVTAYQPDPRLLQSFLRSKDYEVCTGAFKWCLGLVAIRDFHATQVFIPEAIGHEWIKDFTKILCHASDERPWEFLVAYLVPNWTMLPSSWCSAFASVFLTSRVSAKDGLLPAYQHFAIALRHSAKEMQIGQLRAFLPFIATMLELIKHCLDRELITSIESWLAQLPECLEDLVARAQIQKALATRMQQLMEETVALCA